MNTSPLGSALRLLSVLRKHGPSTKSNAALAVSMGVSTRTVNRAITDLVEAGLVTVTRSTPHPTENPTGRLIAVADDAVLPQLQGFLSELNTNGASA